MSSAEPYRSVAGRGEARFEIRGSEFIGYAAPVRSVDEADAFIAEIEETHAEATHNVPAYRVRVESGMLRAWSSDDGEPSGSAGKPALNVLEQRELENVAVVVTRYYGGTKLGVGGLARAYSQGAKAAVEAAGIVQQAPSCEVTITLGYDDSGTVRGIIESEGYDFEADYGETVGFAVTLPIADRDAFCDRIQSATSGRASIDR